jgi:hypothetical protein
MAQHENYSFLPFSRFQEEAHRKTPYIVGGIHPKIEHILPNIRTCQKVSI